MGNRKEETEKISQRKGTGRTQRNLLRQINSHREKNIRPGHFYKERARSYTMETREKKNTDFPKRSQKDHSWVVHGVD